MKRLIHKMLVDLVREEPAGRAPQDVVVDCPRAPARRSHARSGSGRIDGHGVISAHP
jgi:hypothetical protein